MQTRATPLLNFLMHCLRIRRVYKKPAVIFVLVGYTTIGFAPVLMLAIANYPPQEPLSSLISLAWLLSGLVLAWLLARSIVIHAYLRRLIRQSDGVSQGPAALGQTAIAYAVSQQDVKRMVYDITSIVARPSGAPHFRVYLAVWNHYGRSRYGRQLVAQSYYTIFEVRLRRELPHVLFDSRQARRRQFRFFLR